MLFLPTGMPTPSRSNTVFTLRGRELQGALLRGAGSSTGFSDSCSQSIACYIFSNKSHSNYGMFPTYQWVGE